MPKDLMNRLFMIVESLPVDNVVCQHRNATRLKPFKTRKQMVPPELFIQRVAGIYNDRGRDGAWACTATPSEPNRRLSRIGFSSRWSCLVRTGAKRHGLLPG
jgi:hypothetical protein